VFADNLYVYGPPDGPMTEETPQRAQGKKGRTAQGDGRCGDGRARGREASMHHRPRS
jgi:hypothetical protein